MTCAVFAAVISEVPAMLLTINSSVSSSSSNLLPFQSLFQLPQFQTSNCRQNPRWNPQALQFRVSSSANQTVEVASPPENVGGADCATESGADIVRKFYGGINVQDLSSVEELIREMCTFNLLLMIYPRRIPQQLGDMAFSYGRDSVEPAIKPGDTVLVAIRGVAWLLRQFPQLADRF
ncbi:Nuclear transport factor 2 family protein [Prunus dulcis]|uniref:Nuclear transport factor 2 family protein n=1 Tax=Prunus dulcis TaxID=3755 RepID=A0A4Y1QVW3_PRUDU|nr:Nuclear transport factor 2 family protein [Prunus dulcis]